MFKTPNILSLLSVFILSGTSVSSSQTIEKVTKTIEKQITFNNLDSSNLKKWDATMSKDPRYSRNKIASLTEPSSQNIADIHRGLTLWLLTRLEFLSNETNKDIIKIRLEEIANRFYLLDKVRKQHKLDELGKSSILKVEHEKVKQLISKHSKHTLLSISADDAFSKYGLLEHEHVIYMLSAWMSSTK